MKVSMNDSLENVFAYVLNVLQYGICKPYVFLCMIFKHLDR